MSDNQAALQELLANLSDDALFHSRSFQGPYWDNLAGWLQVAWEHEQQHATQIRAWQGPREATEARQKGQDWGCV